MEITKYTPVNKGALLAKVSVYYPERRETLHDVTIFQKDSRKWAAPPSRQYEANGEKRFFSYIQFDTTELRDNFSREVLQALELYLNTHTPEPLNEEVPF